MTRLTGFMALALAVLWTTFASDSVLSDVASGQAAEVVEVNNIIHVYTYLGGSTEAEFVSTFDEGEDWTGMTPAKTTIVKKYTTPTTATKYSRANRSSAVLQVSPYIQAIDECTAMENKIWDYRTDTCIDYY